MTGGAIATAIYSAIQTSRFAEVLPGEVSKAAKNSGFNGDVSKLLAAATVNTAPAYSKVQGINSQVMAAAQAAVLDANIASFKLVFLVAIAFGCVAITMALIARPIDPAMKTNERAVRLENEHRKEITAA